MRRGGKLSGHSHFKQRDELDAELGYGRPAAATARRVPQARERGHAQPG